ncbi:MAG: hypothetical protein R2809_10965 [Flavobacteriales bacterium]
MSRPTVRNIVAEPSEWTYGNLFGEIKSERNGDKFKVRLTPLKIGKSFSSNILVLTPRIKDETFKPLQQYYSVTINGSLVNEETNEQEFIVIGNVTYD